MLKKSEIVLSISIIFSFAAYFISTLLGNVFFMDLLSPVTVGLVICLLISEIGRLGQFKWSTVAMTAGVFIWFVADVLYFINDVIIQEEGLFADIIDDIYLFPDACFALCLTIYMISKLKKSRIEIAFLLSNALCFAITLFVVILRFHIYAAGESGGLAHWKEIIFFFVSFYIIMMCVELFTHIGLKNIFKGAVWTTVGVLGYAILDLEYDFMKSIGLDAENDFINLLYVFFMLLMAIGTTWQINKSSDFEFIQRDFSKRATNLRFLFITVVIALDIIMIETGLLTESLGLYILITLLSYLITNYVLHSQYLNEELIKQQSEQNAILEERIKEKTKDLASANDKLQTLSSTDMLTGLLNRRSSVEFMEEIQSDSEKNGNSFAVFCTDLNHFKPVNDTYGHEMGDKVLVEIGKRLNNLPPEFTAFRIGGDEFLICLRKVRDVYEVEKAADMIRELFNTPIIYDNYIFNLSASMGIAIYPDDSNDYELLVKYADNAMYDVKKSGNKDGYKFFDSGMINVISRKQLISQTIAASDPVSDYILHFQPQVNADRKEIIGVEVFPHLKGEMEIVSPAELIPVAEECGFMTELGIWIVRNALETMTEWSGRFGKDIALSINLSPLQLLDAEFIENLEHLTEEFGFPKDRMILDISSQVFMGNTGSTREIMEAFHKFGFRLSLNDFGGTSINLSYLMDCGINYIKLSRELVSKVESDEGAKILVDSIIRFADAMGIVVTAVGVENESQYRVLREMGINLMQGYMISKPVRKDELERLVGDSLNVENLIP